MKRLKIVFIAIFGLSVGWLMPTSEVSDRMPDAVLTVVGDFHQKQNRSRIRQELLEILLTGGNLERYKIDTAENLSELLVILRKGNGGDSDIDRVVEMDPRSAMSQLIADPGASTDFCERISAAWAYRDPDGAISFLRSQTSYRAQACLYQALRVAYPVSPGKVAEVFKTLPRSWQKEHLEDFFKHTWTMREPGAPPEIPSGDPFANDGHWVEIRAGNEMLESLADDRLREHARHLLESDDSTPVDSLTETPHEFDFASYQSDDFWQRDQLRERLINQRDDTIRQVAASGNYQVRLAAMSILIGQFPEDSASWPEAFAEVETWMNQLGVIPDWQPSHFEMGPFLRGSVAAGWIKSQPAALQRAWASTFVETWVCSEPKQAVDWALTLPANGDRDRAFQTGMVVWAHREPISAANYVTALPDGEIRESAISNTAAAWSCTDLAAVKVWLDSLPESPGKERALSRIK